MFPDREYYMYLGGGLAIYFLIGKQIENLASEQTTIYTQSGAVRSAHAKTAPGAIIDWSDMNEPNKQASFRAKAHAK